MRRLALPVLAALATSGCADQAAGVRLDLDLEAVDLHGAVVRPLAPAEGGVASLLLFVREDCPIANRCAPAIQRLADEYAPRGIKLLLVYADQAITADAVRLHRESFGLSLPAVMDPEHELVRAVGATVTPQAAVILPDGLLAYCGRIDDRWTSFQDARPAPLREDLREALEDVIAGRPVRVPHTEVVGCYLEDVAP